MGQKVNPIGLRLGINRTWDSRWFANSREYGKLLHEDGGHGLLVALAPDAHDELCPGLLRLHAAARPLADRDPARLAHVEAIIARLAEVH